MIGPSHRPPEYVFFQVFDARQRMPLQASVADKVQINEEYVMEFDRRMNAAASREVQSDEESHNGAFFSVREAPCDLASLQPPKRSVRARFERMAMRFGLWPSQIEEDGAVALEVAEACANCHCAKACEKLLTSDRAREIEAECPNAARYQALRRTR